MDERRLEKLRSALGATPPGLNGRDEYMRTAVLALLAENEGDLSFVFQVRAEGAPQGGEIAFPGGRFQPGVDLDGRAAAVRETTEEFGIAADMIDVIGPLDYVAMPAGYFVEPYLAVTYVPLEFFRPSPREVASVFAVPVAYFADHPPETYRVVLRADPTATDPKTGAVTKLFPAKELGLPERYARPWGEARHAIYAWRLPQGTLWGMTARVVRDAVRRIKGLEDPLPYDLFSS